MTENFFLALIILIMAGLFGMTGLRMWYIMHQDTNLGKRVNGLSIDMGKIKKALRDGYTNVTQQTKNAIDVPADMLNMTLEDAAEAIGFSKAELNNPIVRPIAQKIFDGIKAKAADQSQDEGQDSKIQFI